MNLTCTDYFSDEIIEFLESISWGTEAVLFKEQDMKMHLSDLKNLTAYTLTDQHDQIGALIAFINFKVNIENNTYDAQFIRFLSVSPRPEIKKFPRAFIFKIDELLNNAIEHRKLVCCYVESGNSNSKIIVKKKGFVQVATVKTIGISRFFPKPIVNVEKITEKKDTDLMLALPIKKYHDHNLVHFDSLFLGSGYYVYRENGNILAGVQVKKVSWAIEKLSGVKGAIIKKIIPLVPIANRIFNPKKFEFLLFDFIYYQPERAEDFIKLVESVLFLFKSNCGMMWCDEKSVMYNELSGMKSLGILNSMVNSYETHLYVLRDSLSLNHLESLKKMPVMVNPSEFI